MAITGIQRSLEVDSAERSQSGNNRTGGKLLSEKDERQVQQLKKRDAEVRSHGAAHLAAAGGLARGVSYSYTTGPDGKQYAVGGEVKIDTAPVHGDPEATARKMQTVQRAALAPGDPSGQDRAVASQAAAVEAKARQESQQPEEESKESGTAEKNKIQKAYNPADTSATVFNVVSSVASLQCSFCGAASSHAHTG